MGVTRKELITAQVGGLGISQQVVSNCVSPLFIGLLLFGVFSFPLLSLCLFPFLSLLLVLPCTLIVKLFLSQQASFTFFRLSPTSHSGWGEAGSEWMAVWCWFAGWVLTATHGLGRSETSCTGCLKAGTRTAEEGHILQKTKRHGTWHMPTFSHAQSYSVFILTGLS